MLNPRQLLSVYWSAKLGSFTAAAKRMHTTQSVISMRIRELEKELDILLFDRQQRAAALTAGGQRLLRYAEELLRLSSEARESVRGNFDTPSTIRLGIAEVVSVTWLPRLIQTMHQRFPRLRIELDEALTGDLLSRLREGALDLVFAPGRAGGKNLVSISLGKVRFAWMASPKLAIANRRLGPNELQKWPLIALSRESFHHAAIEEWFASAGARCERLDTCKSLGVAASLASAGLGLTYLPVRCYRREIADAQLQIVKTRPAAPPVEFAAFSSADTIDPFVRTVAELAVEISDFDKGPRRIRS
jgi:DNA-binding transcriptional LysR family regulator